MSVRRPDSWNSESGVLMTSEDYLDLLRGGFDDMFEVAVAPEAVMSRLREALKARKPVMAEVEGPEVVEGNIRAVLTLHPPLALRRRRMVFTVHPEGTHDVQDDKEEAP